MHFPRAAEALLSAGILVPLYIYPTPGTSPECSAWALLLDTIAAHPSVPFYTVVNPSSGPGPANSQPDASYQQCVPKLLNYTNVLAIGYVPTGYGNAEEQANVTRDVSTYAGWDAAYRLHGIFFDEVSGLEADLPTYATFASQAYAAFSFVALNPGANPENDAYYDIADLLCTAEDYFDDFSQLSLGAASPPSKQAVILHDGPSSPPTDLISELIATDGIKALYVTDDTEANGGPYNNLPTDLDSFVSAVEAFASA